MTDALHILGAKLKSLFVYFIMLGLKVCLEYFVVRTSSRPEVTKVRSIGENQNIKVRLYLLRIFSLTAAEKCF